ncbi:MAG TPA: hypothetical protein VNO17_06985 [Actinomycetota bacterium]|nr:hypothetical protein [Actinomycetota bacterium]
MTKVDDLRAAFRQAPDPEAFIRERSGLPGPRANLELAAAVAEEGDERLFRRLLRWGPDRAPANTPEEFLSFCGTVGLGSLLARGRTDVLPVLRALAADPRWRTREAVALALQRWGRVDMDGLLAEMRAWAGGSRFEQRAAVAALCEPDLLRTPRHARRVLALLDRITRSVPGARDRGEEGFRALRQALGYGWSVAVAALPEEGLPRLERWMASDDPDVRWAMRENLKKRRLAAVAGRRLDRWRELVGSAR